MFFSKLNTPYNFTWCVISFCEKKFGKYRQISGKRIEQNNKYNQPSDALKPMDLNPATMLAQPLKYSTAIRSWSKIWKTYTLMWYIIKSSVWRNCDLSRSRCFQSLEKVGLQNLQGAYLLLSTSTPSSPPPQIPLVPLSFWWHSLAAEVHTMEPGMNKLES